MGKSMWREEWIRGGAREIPEPMEQNEMEKIIKALPHPPLFLLWSFFSFPNPNFWRIFCNAYLPFMSTHLLMDIAEVDILSGLSKATQPPWTATLLSLVLVLTSASLWSSLRSLSVSFTLYAGVECGFCTCFLLPAAPLSFIYTALGTNAFVSMVVTSIYISTFAHHQSFRWTRKAGEHQ